MTPSFFANRSNLLDTIRAVAVTMVVLFHVATRYPATDLDIVAQQFLRRHVVLRHVLPQRLAEEQRRPQRQHKRNAENVRNRSEYGQESS